MMKLTLNKLQFLDYALKSISSNSDYACFEKSLSLVVDLDGRLWSCDFVQLKRGCLFQKVLNSNGSIDDEKLSEADYPSIQFLKDKLKAYIKKFDPKEFQNFAKCRVIPFDTLEDWRILLEVLISIVESIPEDQKLPIKPILYNTQTLDGKYTLPFMFVDESSKFELVSLIEMES